jgi:hypothetical protein
MKSIDIFKKNYRLLKGSHQNQAIQKVSEMFFGISYKALEDAMWDSNPVVWHSFDCRFIKFEASSFLKFCELVTQYGKETADNILQS